MPKPVFKTHVAANKYKKWNILRENLFWSWANPKRQVFLDLKFEILRLEILRPEIFENWFFLKTWDF
jgi:hypothetical protein